MATLLNLEAQSLAAFISAVGKVQHRAGVLHKTRKQKEVVLLINDYQFCASNFCNYIPSTNSPFQRKIETFKLITKFAEPLAAGCCKDGFTAQGDQQPSSTPFIIQPAGPGHAAQLVLVEI